MVHQVGAPAEERDALSSRAGRYCRVAGDTRWRAETDSSFAPTALAWLHGACTAEHPKQRLLISQILSRDT